jgi:hypothetical protein
VSGPISVTNVDNGDSATATGIIFTYQTPKPTIIAIVGTAVGGGPGQAPAGTQVAITVNDALPGTNKFTIGGKTLFPTSASAIPNGLVPVTFNVTLPTDSAFTFPTAPCIVGAITGTQAQPITVSVTYLNVETGCTDTAADALTITPTTGCVLPPPPAASVTNPAAGCANAGNIVAAGAVTGTTTIVITNTGGQPLVISSATITAQTNATITMTPPSANVAPGGAATFTVTVDPTAAGAVTGTATFATNDPALPSIPVCIQATGTP